MDYINVVLIKPNNIVFNNKDLINITQDYFKDIISPYLEIIQCTKDNIMEKIINAIGLNSESMGDTKYCLETLDYAYQLCTIDYTANNITINDKIEYNAIASYLVMGKGNLGGNIIVVKSKFIEDRTGIQDSISGIDEICWLLYERMVHTCVQLNVDDTYQIKKFIESPSEFLTVSESHNYVSLEINYLHFNLLLFVQMEPDVKTINKRATRLSGVYKIYGTCIMLCKTAENDYINITEELYKKMDATCWGPLALRNLSTEESESKIVNNLDTVINNHYILDTRYKNINNTNMKCVCTGCYRMKYESLHEQKQDWENHKKECLYTKNDINGYIRAKRILEMEKENHNKQINDNI